MKKTKTALFSKRFVTSVVYAKILYLLGEAEIEGLADGLRSVKLNDTPLLSENGTYNFQDVTFDFRNSTVEQSFIEGFPEVRNETSINIELSDPSQNTRQMLPLKLSNSFSQRHQDSTNH